MDESDSLKMQQSRKCKPVQSSNACFLKDERNDYFFVLMAYHLSEHASHMASRGSTAALIPYEKRTILPPPLSQNALKPARIYGSVALCVIDEVKPHAVPAIGGDRTLHDRTSDASDTLNE
jgi:hypothetical protein